MAKSEPSEKRWHRARSRAFVRLKNEYPEAFERIFDEERAKLGVRRTVYVDRRPAG